VTGAVEQHPRGRSDDVDEDRHLAAALHPEILAGPRRRRERVRRVACGRQCEVAQPRRAVAAQQLDGFEHHARFERATADGAEDRAVGGDEHLGTCVAWRRLPRRDDRAQSERLPRGRAPGRLREQVAVAARSSGSGWMRPVAHRERSSRALACSAVHRGVIRKSVAHA
jgi:hypothetical protein